MKKYILICLAMIMCFLSGCGYPAYKTYYKETADYGEIWELTGFRHGYEDKSPLFPDKIDDLNVTSFQCRYDEQLPLGEGVQILLTVNYNDDSFQTELTRIADTALENTENFTDSGLTAYVVRLGEDDCWEYALIDEDEKTVHYIFLYSLPAKEIELEKNFLPDNYVDYGNE